MKVDRRGFITGGAASLVTLAGAPAFISRRFDHDVVIRGGMVFDGTGAAGRVGDVAIAGGRIVEVSARVAGRGTEEIDAKGLAVAPGFIDVHSHGDGSMDEDPARNHSSGRA